MEWSAVEGRNELVRSLTVQHLLVAVSFSYLSHTTGLRVKNCNVTQCKQVPDIGAWTEDKH